jgi:hypothetical protein
LYTHADPVNGIDPTGLFGMALGLGGLMLGAALNTNFQKDSLEKFHEKIKSCNSYSHLKEYIYRF